jgi:hypothetical protein
MSSFYLSWARFGQASGGLLLALLIWANWSAPEMHHFTRPAETLVWQLAPLDSLATCTLQTHLATEPGVAACAVSLRTHCVAVVYHPEELTPDVLYAALRRAGAQVVDQPPVPTTQATIRQCPVPTGYLVALDKFRFTLNLRRFLVTL